MPLEFRFEPAGFAEIGADASGFAFDNERPRHREWLETHALANRLVTNGEYREFIRAGGYTTPDLWLADGWTTRPNERLESAALLVAGSRARVHARRLAVARRPRARLSRQLLRSCRVRRVGGRAAADGSRVGERRADGIAGRRQPARHGLATPRRSRAGRTHPPPILQLWGDVWEWCASAYRPYPRFRPLKGSLGEYNGKFMCNQWVARGGSCVTPPGHVRASYRNFFYPHDRWQFLGIRLAKDA